MRHNDELNTHTECDDSPWSEIEDECWAETIEELCPIQEIQEV